MYLKYLFSLQYNKYQLKNVEAIVFDFDGTLADTLQAWEQVDKIFFKRRNIQYDQKEYFNNIAGLSLKDNAVYTKNRYNIQDTLEQIINEWNTLYKQVVQTEAQLFPGAVELIQQLKSMNIKIGIASAGQAQTIKSILDNTSQQRIQTPISRDSGKSEYCDLYSQIDCIVTCEEVGKNKPDPAVFNECIKRLNVTDKQKVIIFEDTVTGLDAANNAEVKYVICHMSGNHENIQRIKKSDYQINSLVEII